MSRSVGPASSSRWGFVKASKVILATPPTAIEEWPCLAAPAVPAAWNWFNSGASGTEVLGRGIPLTRLQSGLQAASDRVLRL